MIPGRSTKVRSVTCGPDFDDDDIVRESTLLAGTERSGFFFLGEVVGNETIELDRGVEDAELCTSDSGFDKGRVEDRLSKLDFWLPSVVLSVSFESKRPRKLTSLTARLPSNFDHAAPVCIIVLSVSKFDGHSGAGTDSSGKIDLIISSFLPSFPQKDLPLK
jgi:hypothetical protein